MMKTFTFFLLLLPLLGFSQYEFYNTGASITVQSGGLLHVQGTLTNNADVGSGNVGTITNDGLIELEGDLNIGAATSFSTATPGNAAVKFVGNSSTSIQNIKGTGTATFYNLVLDEYSPSNTVVMQTNVNVSGSLVFNASTVNSGTYSGAVTAATYPATTISGATNNGNAGILQTYNGSNEYLLSIQNNSVNAINGYPPLNVITSGGLAATSGVSTTGYVQTLGTPTASGGLQRAIGSVANYVYPVGTALHGYNALQFDFTNISGTANTLKGKFVDYQSSAGVSSNSGYTGTIDNTCVTCGGNYVAPDNLGWNYYFSQNPCNSNNPQWFVLQGHVIQHGFWTFYGSDNTPGDFVYSVEAFPNNIVGDQSLTQEIWRVLKYDNNAGTGGVPNGNDTYGYDPSTADWTTQITGQVANEPGGLNNLLEYSLNTGCYSGHGIPGGLYTSFSDFSLDKSNSGVALPITLVYLEAYPVNNSYIQVQWVTSLEINNSGFKVERSTDGISFTQVGWVAGHDNSTQENTYDYNDYNVAPGIVYYYKLIQVDNNGNQTPTDIVQAQLTGSNVFTIGQLFPNPASDHSSLDITTSESKDIDVKLYDVIGQQLSDKQYSLNPGVNTISFNTNVLAGGTYTAIIAAGDNLYSRKLVITR